jgi:putative folate metabolism gamma-glutamate ligase
LLGLPEESILAVTSKIVAICENRVIDQPNLDKHEIAKQEADCYLSEDNPYHFLLTIKDGILLPSAGIDESNGNGSLILWPKDPQKSANEIRTYLKKRFNLKKVGVIITDSKTTPLRRGTTGVAIAYSGFKPLKNYIGMPDIFGREMRVTQANIVDALAVTSVLTMGEGNEQTPLAVIEEVRSITFQDKNPTKEELNELSIGIDDDLYSQLLTSVSWHKGGSNSVNRQRH